MVFSGDVGRQNDVIIRPPEPIQKADVLVCESTYGDRLHAESDPESELAEIITKTAGRGGIVAFTHRAYGQINDIDDKAAGREPIACAHDRNHMDFSRQGRRGIIAIAMHDERSHGRAVNALVYRSIGFELKLVVHDEMASQKRMRGDRNAIEQCQNGLSQLSYVFRRSRWRCIFYLDGRGQALRPDVHDRIEAGNAICRAFDDFADRPYRQIYEQRVIGDIGEPRP